MSKHLYSATLFLILGLTGSVTAHEGNLTFAPVLKKVTPAVVNISVASTQQVGRNPLMDDPFFRRFFDIPEQQVPRTRRSQSVGSGVIIDGEEGYVVSNRHVVHGADEITITLQDRRQFTAELIGSDAGTDIALLKIDGKNLADVPLGNSEALEVGDFVVAIGNPFGLGQTVTSGIVSALGRSGLIAQGYENYIQTDASINPGNSGGALVDLDGKLVGINTAIISPAGGNVGIGFAVPVNMLQGVVDQLLEYGEVSRGQLGVAIQDVTYDLAEALDLDSPEGALVSQVVDDSSAQAAGIKVGDVIIMVNGDKISNGSDLRNKIGLMRVGDEIDLKVVRDGDQLTLRAGVGEASPRVAAGGGASFQFEGATLRNIDPSHPQYGRVDGVEVASVEPGSPASGFGLLQGDIVLSVNRKEVANIKEFSELVESFEGAMALHIQRGESRIFLVVN